MSLFTHTGTPTQAQLSTWLDDCDYQLCESLPQLDRYLADATPEYGLGSDWESNTLDTHHNTLRPVGLNLSNKTASGLYCPVGHVVGYEHNLPLDQVVARYKELSQTIPTLWYGYKFDGEVWRLCADWEPTNIEEVLFMVNLFDNSQKSFGLKAAARRLLGLVMPTYGSVIENVEDDAGERTFDKVHPKDCVVYGCADADVTGRIRNDPRVIAAVKDQLAVYKLEMRLLPVFRRMLRNGVYADPQRLAELEAELDKDIETLSAELTQYMPGVMLTSPAQLGPALVGLGVKLTEKGKKSGRLSTAKEILNTLAEVPDAHPALKSLVKLRRQVNYKTGYVQKLRAGIERFGPHLFFPFNQIGAPTGRMSAGDRKQKKGEDIFLKGTVPLNVQSFPNPKKDKDALDLRSAILPDSPLNLSDELSESDPWQVVTIDFDQCQLRIAANLSQEQTWIDAFNHGVDIHVRNAQLLFSDPTITEHDTEKRAKGKTGSFAVLFLATAKTVAAQANITEKEAEKMMATYWSNCSSLRTCIDETAAQALGEQSVRTFLGRRRSLAEFYQTKPGTNRISTWALEKAAREAWNTRVQGGEAELFKYSMVLMDTLMTERGWHAVCQMILFVHDEVVFRIRSSKIPEIVPALQAVAEGITIKHWPVPLKTDAKAGPNWGKSLAKLKTLVASVAPVHAVQQQTRVAAVAPPDPRVHERLQIRHPEAR